MKWSLGVAACGLAFIVYKLVRKDDRGQVVRNVTELIGNTPLIRLNYLSKLVNCEVYAKLELSNPGGSAKDRVALAIVESAEKNNLLRSGHPDAVYEGTSGSTGISLALVCRSKGYEAHIVVPDDTSNDKLELLRSLGAHIHLVRPASIADRKHYVNVARSMALEVNSSNSDKLAIFANQFENEENWKVHYKTTGPEILAQMPNLDCFVTGAGTGGTISGVAQYLSKFAKKKVKCVIADVPGSGLFNKVHFGVMFSNKEREGHRRRHQVDTIVEGIGLNRITANLETGIGLISDAELVKDEEARCMADWLVKHEGLFVGSTSAVNCVAACRQARKLGPNSTIVTVLCDAGTRHLSKFYAMPVDQNALKDLG